MYVYMYIIMVRMGIYIYIYIHTRKHIQALFKVDVEIEARDIFARINCGFNDKPTNANII